MNEPIFEIKRKGKKGNYASFVISPLEQGYGDTLGTALRRVLLTSLPGAAITTAKITGVKHKFSSLKGMKEDVVEFLLNLKKVRFSTESQIGEGKRVKASISATSAGVKVLFCDEGSSRAAKNSSSEFRSSVGSSRRSRTT